MPVQIKLGGVHHLRLTVTDVARSRAFYTELQVRDLPSYGICVLPFRDPDNVQLELTAPL